MSFWDELSLPWQICMDLAWEAYCDDCYPIGAVVTDAKGKILTCGRNRVYEKIKSASHTPGNELAHAETEALCQFDGGVVDSHSCALYTTTEPCPMCLGTFYMSGLRTLHFGARDPFAGSTNLLGTTWYLSRKPIKVIPPQNRLFELIIMGMMIEQDYQRNHGDLSPIAEMIYQRWMDVVPECVSFGRTLFETGILSNARSNRIHTANMLDSVMEKVQS